jgi:peptide/nickel transport system substrate-binding protein
MKKTLLMVALILSSAALAKPYQYSTEDTVSKSSEVKTGGTLRFTQAKDFDSYNPFVSAGRPSIPELVGYGAGALITNKTENLSEYEGFMAETFSVSANNRTYTFNLRPELKWSDGKAIVADDFILALRMFADPKMEDNLEGYMTDNGKPVTWKKLGERSFSITFPRATVQNTETVSYFFPVPSSIFGPLYAQGVEAVKKIWDINTDPTQIVVAGAFKPSRYVKGERLTLVKNTFYGEWVKDSAGKAVPFVDSLQYAIVPDANAQLAQFLAGNVDTYQPDTRDRLAQVAAAARDKKLDVTVAANTGPNTSVDYLYFNLNKSSDAFKQNLFRNVKFRQAMSMLTNKEAMIDLVLGGLGTPAYTSVYPLYKEWVAPNVDRYKFNPTEAAKLLSDLGFKKKGADGILVDGRGNKLTFTLLSNSENTRRQGYAKIFQDEAKKVGVDVKTSYIPFNQLLDIVYPENGKTDRKFDAAITGVGGGGFINPVGVAATLKWGGDLNGYNYSDKALAPWETQMYNLFIKSQGEFDTAKRKAIANQIQKIQADNLGFIYIASQNAHYAWDNRLRGERPKKYQNPLYASSYFGPRALDLTWIGQ